MGYGGRPGTVHYARDTLLRPGSVHCARGRKDPCPTTTHTPLVLTTRWTIGRIGTRITSRQKWKKRQLRAPKRSRLPPGRRTPRKRKGRERNTTRPLHPTRFSVELLNPMSSAALDVS